MRLNWFKLTIVSTLSTLCVLISLPLIIAAVDSGLTATYISHLERAGYYCIPSSAAAGNLVTNNIVPFTDSTYDVGASGNEYAEGYFDNVYVKGDNVTRAATFVVGPTGSQADFICDGMDDDAQIQAAIDAAIAAGGGKVLLLTGTYNCADYIVPSDTNPIVLEGQGPATILSWDSGTSSQHYLVGKHTGTITGLTIRNLKIIDTKAVPQQSYGIMTGWTDGATTCSDIVIDSVETEECNIWLGNVISGKCVIQNCYVHDISTGDRGIGFNYCNNAQGLSNRVENVSGMGIGCPGNSNIQLSGNIIINASLVAATSYAIDTEASGNVSITENFISSRYGVLSENATESIQINDNVICGIGSSLGTGIKVWRTTTGAPQVDLIQIHNNKISNIQILISVVDEDNASIVGNTCYMSDRYINVSKSSGWGIEPTVIKISNNTLVSCGRAAYQGAINTGNCTGVYVEQNAIIGDNIANTYAVRYLALGSRIVNNVFSDYPTMIATIASGATVGIEQNTGYATENYGSSVGTGAQQTIAHGLNITPTKAMIGIFTDNTSAAYAYQSASPDATNIYVTATAGTAWHWATVGK